MATKAQGRQSKKKDGFFKEQFHITQANKLRRELARKKKALKRKPKQALLQATRKARRIRRKAIREAREIERKLNHAKPTQTPATPVNVAEQAIPT
jgi:hypothetical protein